MKRRPPRQHGVSTTTRLHAILGAGAAAIVVLAAGCSLASPAPPAVVPTFSTTTTTTGQPTATARVGLPTSCKDLLNGQQLDAVLRLPLSGVVRTVVGQPSPSVV